MAPFEMMQNGTAAFKAKRYEDAEDFLIAAFQAYSVAKTPRAPGVLDPRLTVRCVLGKVYRAQGRYEEAIDTLEKSLALPGTCGELIGIFRFLAKVAKQSGDRPGQVEWFRRMFCMANLNVTLTKLRRPSPVIVDWDRVGRFVEDLRQRGKIYTGRWAGEKIAGDTLLSARDYKTLDELLPKAGSNQAVVT